MTLNLDLNDPLTVTCKGRSRVQGHTNSTLKAQVTDRVSDSTSVTMPFDLASNSSQDKLGQKLKAKPRQVWPSTSQSWKKPPNTRGLPTVSPLRAALNSELLNSVV